MTVTEPGGEFTPEPFGGLTAHIEEIDKSFSDTQLAIIQHFETQKDENSLNTSFTNHVLAIKSCLRFVFSEANDISQEDKLKIAANILREDDTKRVNFFKKLTGTQDKDVFYPGYTDLENFNREIAAAFEQLCLDGEDTSNFIDLLINQHVEFIHTDLNAFLQSEAFLSKTNQSKRKQEIINRLLGVATTATGVFLGGLALRLLDKKFK